MSDVEDKDAADYAELLRVLDQVDAWIARIDPGAKRPQVAPGSPLSADDARTHPYETSHAAWHALSHAVDHLHCLLALLRDARVIHMYAPYSLVRGALENASAAVWMLSPTSRAERVGRRLRFAASDIRNGEQVKELTGLVGPRPKQDRLDEVLDLAKRSGFVEKIRNVGYGEIVEAAGDGAKVVSLSWRLCSGMAHGDYWTTFSAAERVELPGAPPGLGTFKITANVKTLMYVTTIATAMTRRGWSLYDQRCAAPY